MAGVSVKRFSLRRAGASLLLSLAAALCQPANAAAAHWVTAWASAQMIVDPPNAPTVTLSNSTLRQLVRVSVGGTRLRVRLSNAFGTAPVTITGVDVARALSPQACRIDTATDRPLTFSGERMLVIPAGAEYVSDPVELRVPALGTVAVTMHFADAPQPQSGHPGSRASSYVASGDQLAAADLQSPVRVEHWYYLSGVDVQSAPSAAAIAVLGDSITDGHGIESDTNNRWTDVVAERLNAARGAQSPAVLNLGIGGNRVVNDGLGPNALARFDRDVMERSGVRYLIILEGVNDIGMLTRDAPASDAEHRLLVARILAAYRQMVARAHEHGIKAIGATVMPYGANTYYHPGPANEADRQAINRWIRARGNFDAVIDFDALMRDSAHPQDMRKDYDSGDGLHPSVAGYRAMGEAVPLALFKGPTR